MTKSHRLSQTQKIKRRRANLYGHQFGKCHWCSCKMVLFPTDGIQKLPDNFATIDHLRDRFNPHRLVQPVGGEQRWVLACKRCNEARGRASERGQSPEALWERSGAYPQAMRRNGVVP